MPNLKTDHSIRAALCIAIAYLGGLAADMAGLPLPYMLGAIGATLCAAMAGVPLSRPPMSIVIPMRVILGVLLGSAMTPDLLDRIAAIAGTLALVPVFIIASSLVGTIYYERVAGYTREEAYFCALPGGLHVMTLYAEERGVDIARVSIAHAFRITFVVLLATLVANFLTDIPRITVHATTSSIVDINDVDLVWLACAGGIGWALGRMTGLAGAQMVVPMLCSAALHISGVTAAKPPSELIVAAQSILGAYIGSRFVGETFTLLSHAMRHALIHVGLMLMIAAVFASVTNLLLDVPFATGILSFAPGGMSEIGLIALVLGLDVGFVATVQLCRLIAINLCGPYLYKRIGWLLGR
ncbi:MAG: AbrB family transcriptional regulator [Hyphomicrobiaceae bacterium]